MGDNRVPAQQTKPQKKEAEKEQGPLRTGGLKGRPSEQSNAKSALGPKAWQTPLTKCNLQQHQPQH